MILLKNTTFINWETLEFSPANILVEEGLHGKIVLNPDLQKIDNSNIAIRQIDCSGKYVTKSFAVGHHHVYSALSRGMGAPAKNPGNFREILQYIWWTLDSALDKEMIEASALATGLACAKAGSTFVIDHHASPNAIDGSLEIIANAFERIGLSHLLCYEISDRDGIEKAEQGLEESNNYLKNKQGLVGLHASFTLGNKSMKKAATLMKKHNSGIHIHVAEDKYDQEHCQKTYGKRVINRLHDLGFLDSSKTILAHCLHLDKHEEDLIRNSKAWVVENIESNLNNKVGYFDGSKLGERIFLGTDGMHSDMLRSAQSAFFVGQMHDNVNFLSAYQRFRNVHHYLEQNSFAGDGENNLVILDYDSPTPINASNFLGHFVFGLISNHVSDVISQGKFIIRDKKPLNINEDEVLGFAREQAQGLWAKMQKTTGR